MTSYFLFTELLHDISEHATGTQVLCLLCFITFPEIFIPPCKPRTQEVVCVSPSSAASYIYLWVFLILLSGAFILSPLTFFIRLTLFRLQQRPLSSMSLCFWNFTLKEIEIRWTLGQLPFLNLSSHCALSPNALPYWILSLCAIKISTGWQTTLCPSPNLLLIRYQRGKSSPLGLENLSIFKKVKLLCQLWKDFLKKKKKRKAEFSFDHWCYLYLLT